MKIFIFTLVILLTGCATTDYKFGDITRKVVSLSEDYCSASTPEARNFAKAGLELFDVDLGADYCATLGFVDMMING